MCWVNCHAHNLPFQHFVRQQFLKHAYNETTLIQTKFDHYSFSHTVRITDFLDFLHIYWEENLKISQNFKLFLCRLRRIGVHRDRFVRCLSVCPSVRLCVGSVVTLNFLVVMHSCFAGDSCISRNAATMFVLIRNIKIIRWCALVAKNQQKITYDREISVVKSGDLKYMNFKKRQ